MKKPCRLRPRKKRQCMLNRKGNEDAAEEVVVEVKEEAKDKAEEKKASRTTMLEDEVVEVEVEVVEDLNQMWIVTIVGSMETMRVSVGPRRKQKAMRIMHKPKREEMTQSC